MNTRWTELELAQYVEKNPRALRGNPLSPAKTPKPLKFKNKRTEVDGIVFDSKRESSRYRDLKIMQDLGFITELELQPVYEVTVNGRKIGNYKADFRYRDESGKLIAEDCKGVRTQLYLWKKRLVEAIYGITIIET